MSALRYSIIRLAAVAAAVAFASHAAVFTEDFSSDPAARGWAAHGDTNLFHWNASAGNLAVTWDSSKPNSFFALPLGTIVTTNDDFSAAFDLELDDFQVVNFFQVAIGFLNLRQGLSPAFYRGSGYDSPNLVEFSFFPDPGMFGPSITATMIDWTGTNWNRGGFLPDTLTTGDVFRVSMAYTATNRVVKISLTKNGEPFGEVPDATLTPGFLGFQADTFSINSYSEAGQDPSFIGKILAHGTVDKFTVTVPDPPVGKVAAGFNGTTWQTTCASTTNWIYTFERTGDGSIWTALDEKPGTGSALSFRDENPPADRAFYRVAARRP